MNGQNNTFKLDKVLICSCPGRRGQRCLDSWPGTIFGVRVCTVPGREFGRFWAVLSIFMVVGHVEQVRREGLLIMLQIPRSVCGGWPDAGVRCFV